MKKLFFFLPVIVIVTAMMSGCATTKFRVEPESPEMDTLIIGQIEVTVTGWPPPTEINGVHRRNVQVYLYNNFEGERVQLVSKGEGVFYLVCSHDSRAIDILGFVVAGKSKAGTSKLTLRYDKEFIPERGKVNNIGRIIYTVKVTGKKHLSSGDREIQISENYEVQYNTIEPWFREAFPDSEWNNKEWVDIPHT